MNIINNALSAKNVRQHGMSTPKWTIKDKITQYKGLVTLYKRDRQITEVDTAVATKRQSKGLQSLRKAIDVDRNELNNAVVGDRQHLRNILADCKELQLAYQNLEPKIAVENIHQINFTKRKALDKLHYQMKLKSKQLIDLKLEESALQDRLKYEGFDKIKEEKNAQIITGKVQDALLKKEAALQIRQTYTQISDLMKKDALYFDGILLTIQNDYWFQCRCVLNATKQGQLATEYKHDREQEFVAIEKAIVQDMKLQKFDLDRMREQAENLQLDLKMLLRRDSDLTTCIPKVEESKDLAIIRRDLQKIETILKLLTDTTLVTSFEKIYPSLEMQRSQKKKLNALAKKCERDRDIILNKSNHAEVMRDMLKNTMVETTGEYKKSKLELIGSINKQYERTDTCNRKQLRMCNLTAKIRISLKQLQHLCMPIKIPTPQKEMKQNLFGSLISFVEEIPEPEEEENDGVKIIEEIIPKLQFLMSNVKERLDSSNNAAAYKVYEFLMKQRRPEPELEVINDESFLEGFNIEVSHILTREDIKKQSNEIVAANTQEDDLVFIPIKKKKRKFK
ncbi:uncharacterized protein LOC135135374 [Zophobas morio]|uniref:uncharacterized protein LOC135135374 n=1 Tax=Zophobas morio TaxID=2755281 RepID=UPI003083BDF3